MHRHMCPSYASLCRPPGCKSLKWAFPLCVSGDTVTVKIPNDDAELLGGKNPAARERISLNTIA